MSLKAGLTPLDSVPGLSDEVRSTLRAFGVTTAEEIIGMARASRSSLGEVLGADEQELNELIVAAESRVPSSVLDSLAVPLTEHGMGALPPRSRAR